LPRADWGKAVAHGGLGITIFAVSGMLAWKIEDIRVVQIGETFPLGAYEVRLDDVREVEGPNYQSTMGFMTVLRDGAVVTELRPEKRIYPVAGMPTTEAAIDYGFLRDVYLVLGDRQQSGGWAVRSYIEPFANWLWAGCILMALGGFLSLSDRRYRVAAGARKVPAGMPAE
jgi:cytochrome c-type biogenesis protein CcmF